MKRAYWINVKMESSSYPNTSATQYNSKGHNTSESFKLMYFFFHDLKPLLGQGLQVMEALRSHSDTPQPLGLLWTSDQPDAETST